MNSTVNVGHIQKYNSFITLDKLINPIDLDKNTSRLMKKLKISSPDMFALNFKTSKTSEIHAYLKKLLEGHKGENAMAMFDPFGNLLMAFADAFEESPVSSHLFRLINTYFNFYFNELSIDSVITVGGYKKS